MKNQIKEKDFLQKLRRREYGVACNYCLNTKMLRNIICADSRTFKLVWKKRSNKPIYYESQKIYTENYRTCYTVNGINELPRKLYTLPPCRFSQKILEALICEARLSEILPANKGHASCFLALSGDGWLRRYDANTGEVLQEIYLSLVCRFKYLTWDEDGHSVVVKTTLNKSSSNNSTQRSDLVTLAVFSVFPLEFVARLAIRQKIFGNDVSDAIISIGFLCISHTSGIVRLYSFEHILRHIQFEAKLGVYCDQLGGVTGTNPAGIPCNIELRDRPVVLFEVTCADNDLRMGGYPWHYIISPRNNRNIFKVYSMDTKTLALNGTLRCDTPSIRPERALFHPDDSGRILHFTSSELRVHSISSDNNGVNSLNYNFHINTRVKKSPVQKEVQTRSGRRIRVVEDKVTNEAFDQGLLSFNYEDEIDLMIVHGTEPYNSSDSHAKTYVSIYDNKNGTMLKKINLKSHEIEHLENTITMDGDLLVNIRKDVNGKHTCYLYRLTST